MFEIVRESVSAEAAAIHYGIEIKRHRARCPFHNGEDFNLSFKGNGFNCFVCGEKGDSIKFTQSLFGLAKPLDALKRLNSDFRLGLDVEGGLGDSWSPTLSDIRRKSAERDLPECVSRILREYSDTVYYLKTMHKPETELWAFALHNLEFADYLCNLFESKTASEKLEFIFSHMEEIKEYEEFNRAIEGLRKCNTDDRK
ncbi:MAG: hypothetical protein LBL98_04190 [Ruminococcus sp.]|jgi:hypothetical protein|nr:hypothetical protein [Ruminococcus sp.]